MSGTPADGRTDAELIVAARAGDSNATAALFERHRDAGMRLARSLTEPAAAADLVAEAYARILAALRRGGGPDEAFRTYLLRTIRNLHIDSIRATRRETLVDDFTDRDHQDQTSSRDLSEQMAEATTVSAAFRSLPPRWQEVLWHLAVRDESPRDVAARMGLSPNSLAQLAFRAREGLRLAYLDQHLALADDPECTHILARLPKYARGGLTRTDREQVRDHLETCERCSEAAGTVDAINHNLGAVVVPALLGSTVAQATGNTFLGTGALAGRTRWLVGAGVAAVAAAVVAGLLLLGGGEQESPTGTAAPEPSASSSGPSDDPTPVASSAPPTPSPTPSPTVVATASPSPSEPVSTPPAPSPTPDESPTPPPPASPSSSPGVDRSFDTRVGRLTGTLLPTRDRWFHVTIPAIGPDSDLHLSVSVTDATEVFVHHGEGFGNWVCTDRRRGSRILLDCRLPGSDVAPDRAALAFDVRTDVAALVEATLAAADPRDPDDGNNRGSLELEPPF